MKVLPFHELESSLFNSFTDGVNYNSEGSILHINGVWPSFLNFS